MKSETTNQF